MNLKNILKNNVIIVLFFILLIIFRLSLITKGHRFDTDEDRYLNALYCWTDLFKGNFYHAVAYFFNAAARPGFILVSLIPAWVQYLFIHLKMTSLFSLHFYDIPSFFNAVVTIINSVLFYRILMLIVPDRMIAVGGVISYSLLVNTNLYIRHLFPYDYSLLFFLILLLLVMSEKQKGVVLRKRTALICGFLSGLGSLIYPGYYAFAFIILVFFLISASPNFLKNVSRVLLYVFSFSALVLCFEWMSRMEGVSYLSQLGALSASVTHGDFSEGFLFIIRYLRDVEGLIGIALFILFILYCAYFIFKDHTAFKWLLIAAILMYSLNAVFGIIFHKMVFYGRALHMYFPFLVMAAWRAISLIPARSLRRSLAIVLVVCSFVSFIPAAYTYARLSYPGDIFFQYLTHVRQDKILWISADQESAPDIDNNYSAVLINFEPFDNFGYPPPVLSSNMALAVSRPHPLNFAAYTFEDYTPDQRKLIKDNHYEMQIYLNVNFDNKEVNDKISFYKAFNLRSPFVYTNHMLGEYICADVDMMGGQLLKFFNDCPQIPTDQKGL